MKHGDRAAAEHEQSKRDGLNHGTRFLFHHGERVAEIWQIWCTANTPKVRAYG
jgi:hypothetical protein